jgi:two-component system CheB/CheR fusion protein
MGKKKTPKEVIAGNGDERQDGSGFLVVGIGASAGGIQALSEFFANVRHDDGIAYVVILHLSPDHDSHLAHVLQQVTKLPVEQVTKQTKLHPNNVYVVPPDKSLAINDGNITIKAIKTVEERRAPVDIFFRTLAEYHGSNAVGVILSGSGANGSMGLKRIKEMGGATFAQNPREAEFNEMPRNAIATDLVDMILPVADIPQQIINYRDRIGSIHIPEEATERHPDQQNALREIFTQLRVRTGHDFTNYKRPTMIRRIERRMGVCGLTDPQEYTDYLRQHPEEHSALLRDLLISVTNFFRDKKAFEALEHRVFPKLVSEKFPNRGIRIWVAGCATGEEAYSIAMIAAEQTADGIDGPPIQIFATDIDEQAISIAREGLYTLNDAADVSPERLKRFFIKEGDSYRVRREIREMILFAQHNLIKDPPFSHLDLVSCRNLLIYLNHNAQERVMETVHFALNPGGYLFIGSSESVEGSSDLFAAIDKGNHVYQSRQAGSRPLPVPDSVPVYRTMAPPPGREQKSPNDALERMSYNDLHLKLLEEIAPPSVVVNESHEIVHLSPRAGKYMQVAGGEPTNNLLKLVREELRIDLRTALFQAVQHKNNVEVENIKVGTNGKEERINLQVRPITNEADTSRGFILVVFESVADGDGAMPPANYAPPEPIAKQLEEELIRSRTQLQSALEQSEIQSEELRASNEELQAMNEELRSSAEELETSKEELQSINEELSTVNQELKIKIEELSYTNNNFTNLLNSIDIAVIFLDRSLRINLFSPAANRIFNLITGDIGRPLLDITNRLKYDDLIDDASCVLDKLQTLEREVSTDDDRVFVMRILPYRTLEDRIIGVVLTFVDVTERKRAEVAVNESAGLLAGQKEAFQAATNNRALADSLEPLVRTAVKRFGGKARAAFYAVSDDGKTLHHVVGMPAEYAEEIDGFAVGEESLACGLAMAKSEPVITPDVELDPLWKDWRAISRKYDYRGCWSFPVRTALGPSLGTFALYFREPRHATGSDIDFATTLAHSAAIIISRQTEATEREEAETLLRESETKFRRLFDTMDEGYAVCEVVRNKKDEIVDWRFIEANSSFEKQKGLVGSSLIGRLSSEATLGMEIAWRETVAAVLKYDRSEHLEQYDRSTDRWFDATFFPWGKNEFALLYYDVTDRKRTEALLRSSEERLSLLMSSFTDIALFTTDTDGMITAWNPGAEKIFGYRAEEMIDKRPAETVFTPEDRASGVPRQEMQTAIREGSARDERWHMRKNGERFFASGFMVPLIVGNRHIGFGKIAQDLTERGRGEQAIRERGMLKRLVEAQEEERQRIARDLHDQLGQQLTGLRLKLESLKSNFGAEPAMIKAIDDTQVQAKKIDDEVSFMTWELRPTALDNLGLRVALGNYVEEWSKNFGIESEYHTTRIRRTRMVPEIEINLYRVAQEALNNVAKHAKAKKVDVLLEVGKVDIVLVVEDDGIGFDTSATARRTKSGAGLGLIGMRERAALLGGTLELESTRLKGTTVIARVPARMVEEKGKKSTGKKEG